MWFEVITSALGTVYAGSDEKIALDEFKFQRKECKEQNVVLLVNGEVNREHLGGMGATLEWREMVEELTQGR